jgi:hypothetical protein
MIEKGYYLPDIRSRIITTDYLVKVSKGINFGIKSDQIKSHPLERKRWSSLDMVSWLSNRLYPLELGFSSNKLPNRKWLLDVVWSIEPKHEIFDGGEVYEELVEVPIEFLENSCFLDPYISATRRPIFLKTPETKRKEKRQMIKRRILRKERRWNFLRLDQQKLGKDVSDLQAHLDSEIIVDN